MENFAETLEILRPGSHWVIEYPGNYENLIWHEGNTDPKPTEEECLAVAAQAAEKAVENRTASYWRSLRRMRNVLLAESDWMAVSDRTPTAEQLAYRQALRDLPANTVDPANPVWPVKP